MSVQRRVQGSAQSHIRCVLFQLLANASRSSACSIGITVFKDNKPVEEKYWLIRPEPLYFTPINISVHGIREADVINEKTFAELWPDIQPYLEGNLVVAHNASFDFSVLRNTLDLYGIDYPELKYACTMVASKIFYNYLQIHQWLVAIVLSFLQVELHRKY